MFERDTNERDTKRDTKRTGVVERPRPVAVPAQVFAKLEIGAADSPFEREADRIAGQVMRKLDGAGGDTDVMSRMESAFGADFSGVRLHTGREAAGMSAAIQAKAFTHGSDIYFGEGQFRPESRAGQELLAHELTHTLQQGAAGVDTDVARRSPLPSVTPDTEGSVRRWALDQGVDLTQITALRTAGTAQPTFMAKDSTGKEIVIKPGSVQMNLLQLADTVHESVHKTDYVKSYEIDAGQKAILATKIADPTISGHSSWTDTGKAINDKKLDGESDADKARRKYADTVLTTKQPLTAMRIVDGKNAKGLAKEKGTGANKGGSAMRDRFESPMFMRSLGHGAVTDAFTGNGDRFDAVNLGNFMSTGRDNLTLIDNMDMNIGAPSFDGSKPGNWIPNALVEFATDPRSRAQYVIDLIVRDLPFEGEDKAGLTAWLNEPGANRKQFMLDDMMKGVEEAKDRIVKVYSKDKKKSEGRALKSAIKGIDQDAGQIDFWEVLKARAMVLRDPGKAGKMAERLTKRHAAAQKKANRKKS